MDTKTAIKKRLHPGETVDRITELNISSLNLDHLDAHAFENMEFLEFLDVSSNRLKTIPQLPLPNLKKLYCHFNKLTSVLFLKHFPLLEELFLRYNPLSLADCFIAVSLLPKLITMNDKDCSNLREIEHMLEQRLQPQITKVWEMHFSEKLECDLSPTQLTVIQNQFISHSICHMKDLPLGRLEIPSDFMKFKVEKMATEFFKKIVEEVTNANRPVPGCSLSPENVARKSPSSLKSSQVHRSPEKESNINQRRGFSQENSLQHTPQKTSRRKSIVPSDALDKIIFNSGFRLFRKQKLTVLDLHNGNTLDVIQLQTSLETRSPRKATLRGQNVQENHSSSKRPIEGFTEVSPNSTTVSPQKKLKPLSTLRKQYAQNHSFGKKPVEEVTEISTDSTDISPPQQKLKPMSPSISCSYRKNLFGSSNATLEQHHETNGSNIEPYSAKMFLRCHSRDPSDCGTQVWCAAFEPDLLQPGETTTTVATCGGTSICLIDCSTGDLMMQYRHINPKEDFYCLAWTVVQIGKSDTSIIAAAGLNKEVVLLHPSQRVNYHTFKAHSQAINCLVFHKKMSTWLLTGSSDGTVCLWDIGIPSNPEFKTVCKKLAVFQAKFPVLQLAISLNKNIVLGACDGALFGWTLNGVQPDRGKKKPQFQLQLPEMDGLSDMCNKKPTIVDGLCMLSDTHCAVKVVGSGQIHICNLVESLKSVPEENAGMEPVPLLIVGTLDWSNCQTAYLYLRASEDGRILACGDDNGGVWIYDICNFINGLGTEYSRDTEYKPDQMLSWPSLNRDNDKIELPEGPKVNINSVALSSQGNYLLACTDKNLACIWTTCISN